MRSVLTVRSFKLRKRGSKVVQNGWAENGPDSRNIQELGYDVCPDPIESCRCRQMSARGPWLLAHTGQMQALNQTVLAGPSSTDHRPCLALKNSFCDNHERRT